MTPAPKPEKPWDELKPKERSRLLTARAQYRAKNPSIGAKRIARQLRDIKKWLGETDTELAARFDVTRVTFNRWLNCLGHCPSNGSVEKIRELHRDFKLKYGESRGEVTLG